MSESQLPMRFDPIHLGKVGFCGHGDLAVKGMARLAKRLQDTVGVLAVTLELARDEAGVVVAKGSIRGDLSLLCQRCLKPMQLPLQIEYKSAFVQSERQLNRLPAAYEPIIVTEYIETSAMIEDEVLLSLPIVALHDNEKCRAVASEQVQDAKVSPFAELGELMKHKPHTK